MEKLTEPFNKQADIVEGFKGPGLKLVWDVAGHGLTGMAENKGIEIAAALSTNKPKDFNQS